MSQFVTTPRDFPRELRDGADWLVTMGTASQVAECARSAADELERLRGWLRYIAGNFRDGKECAREALDGNPTPEGFL